MNIAQVLFGFGIELYPHTQQSICCWQDVTDQGKYRTIRFWSILLRFRQYYVYPAFSARSLHLQSGNILLNQLLADVAAPSCKYKFKYETLKILSSRTVKDEEVGGERIWWIKK